jgi:hypothetical protein
MLNRSMIFTEKNTPAILRPWYAHVFKDRELIERLNAVINPHYFIYQSHPAQEEDPLNPVNFEEMIKDLDFKDKFINSAEYRVEIISLIPIQAGNAIAVVLPSETDNLRISAFYINNFKE